MNLANGPAGPRPDQRLGRDRRLLRAAQFAETYAQGRRWVGQYLVLWLRSGDGAARRLGVVTSRAVGGAVQRTRARRLLREVYRRHRHCFAGPYDVILVARRSILQADWKAITADLLSAERRAGLLAETGASAPNSGI